MPPPFFTPRPFFPFGVLLTGAVAGGAIVAMNRQPPPPGYGRYPPPPPPGYGYGRCPPPPPGAMVTVRVQPASQVPQAPLIVIKVEMTNELEEGGVLWYELTITTHEGLVYTTRRRYSQFATFEEDLDDRGNFTTRYSPFPPKHRIISTLSTLSAEQLVERRIMLQAWLNEVIAAARNVIWLREPLYAFCDLAAHYPPPTAAAWVPVAQVSPATSKSAAVPPPIVSAVPYAECTSTPLSPSPSAVPVDDGDFWLVEPYKPEFDDVFRRYGGTETGYLSLNQAREALIPSGASEEVLRDIWELADVDKDGKLNSKEFALAMFLCRFPDAWRRGQPLPPELVPPRGPL